MRFERVWDSSCPRVWDQWEAGGTRYVIQDLPPEDFDLALQLLVESFLPDEPLCRESGVVNDPVSVQSWRNAWLWGLGQRVSLACYVARDGDGGRELVGLNCCFIDDDNVENEIKMEGEAFINALKPMFYIHQKFDCNKHLETDTLLGGMGLVVKEEFRRANIGTRILKAREPLCRAYGIKGTSTIFTAIESQKCAERVGFTTLAVISWKELAEAGFKFPSDEGKVVKFMVKKYD